MWLQACAARGLWNRLHAFYTSEGERGHYPSWAECDQWIREQRREHEWLAQLPAKAAQQVLRHYRQSWVNHWAGTHARPTVRHRKGWRPAVDTPQAYGNGALNLTRVNRKWAMALVTKAGRVKVRLSQPLPDRITGARLVLEADGWYMIVRGERAAQQHPRRDPDKALGIDRGVAHTLAVSDGTFFDQPPTLTDGEARRLYRLERQAACRYRRGQRPSKRLQRTHRQIARLRARQARRRHDFQHQASATIARSGYGTIALEGLRVASMTASAKGTVAQPGENVAQKAGLNRAILDQGWSAFADKLAYKAAAAGASVVKVKAAYTSQECAECHHVASGNRESQAVFRCVACGHEAHADTDAARVIAQRGREAALQDAEPIAVRRAAKRQPTTAARRRGLHEGALAYRQTATEKVAD